VYKEASPNPRKPVTVPALKAMKAQAERIAVVTAYDASFAHCVDAAGVDVVLVGDSLGMVVQGHDSTLPVTLDDMVYHTRCVRRGLRTALLVADMPFMAASSPDRALESARRLMAEGGAAMVKLEGGGVADLTRRFTELGVPVCGHLGLTPQSVHQLGGYRVQGRDRDAADRLLDDARALEAAGAGLLVLECLPSDLASAITAALSIPTIGIGAGIGCDGQVLVLHDLLGVTPGRRPRFTRNFLAGAGGVEAAVRDYVTAVREGRFPAPEESYD